MLLLPLSRLSVLVVPNVNLMFSISESLKGPDQKKKKHREREREFLIRKASCLLIILDTNSDCNFSFEGFGKEFACIMHIQIETGAGKCFSKCMTFFSSIFLHNCNNTFLQ